jgi:hypothetical protein
MITAAQWVSATDILVCLKNGNVVQVQNALNPDLVSKKVFINFEYNPIWSMQLVSTESDGFTIILGQESGEIINVQKNQATV